MYFLLFFPLQNCSMQERVSHVISLFPLRLQHCSSDGPEGPSGFLERLCFEMKKGYKETMLQLLLSPIHIFISDNYQVRNAAPTDDPLPSVFPSLRFFTLNSLLNITQEKLGITLLQSVTEWWRDFSLSKGKHDTLIQLSAADLPVRGKRSDIVYTSQTAL